MRAKNYFAFMAVILFIMPKGVFAHGTEEEHRREIILQTFYTYSTGISAFVLIAGVIALLTIKNRLKTVNVKQQEGRKTRDQLNKRIKLIKWVTIISSIVFIVTGALSLINSTSDTEQVDTEQEDTEQVRLMHIHGLGITPDGNEVYVPAHDGLKVFKNGTWRDAEGDKHDYMGFSMVNDGFYSSGHPVPGSELKNPLGIVKSIDMGKTLEMLDLYGEVDFHGMAVGYESHAIYVLNSQENSKMKEPGLYYSIDEAKSWAKSNLEGVSGQISTLAVHPVDEAVVAVGTTEGIFVSKDHGNTFSRLSDLPATAVTFSTKGELFGGSVSDHFTLNKYNVVTSEQTEISIPSLSGENAISYIAVHRDKIIFTTFEKDIYMSSGDSWLQLADRGKALNHIDH